MNSRLETPLVYWIKRANYHGPDKTVNQFPLLLEITSRVNESSQTVPNAAQAGAGQPARLTIN